jgi:hypothetical protein
MSCLKSDLLLKIRTRLPMPENEYQTGETPTTMAFLADAMLRETHDATLSTLAECVLLANISGRYQMHKGMSSSAPLSSSESHSRAFWARHNWLAAAVERAHGLPSFNSTVAVIPAIAKPAIRSTCVDPMRALNQFLARSTVVSLSVTAERVAWQNPEYQAMAASYKDKALRAASEMVLTMEKAPKIAFLKVCLS